HTAGIVAPWKAGGEDAWVGTPGMNAPIRAMAEELGVHFSKRVETIERHNGAWRLEGEATDTAPYDAAIIAVPSEQAAPMLVPHRADWSELAEKTVSDPCWTLMLAFEQRISHEADAIRDAGPIGWAARDSAKPDRGDGERWVIQADPRWSAEHLEDSADDLSKLLLQEFATAIGQDLPAIAAISAHRWRFAKSGRAGAEKLWDADLRLGACGDWLIAPRVEAAFVSGRALADKLLEQG
ncbi:MAG: FAD-dependent oxidoreductase, partial [Erythrobacter sp.]|nr:FAD-dependent oxidoreductase [Erythrobacter sp.]